MKEENKKSTCGIVIALVLVVVMFYVAIIYIPNNIAEAIVDEYETNLFTKNGTILSVERVRSGFGIWLYDACEVYFIDGEMIAFRENSTGTYSLMKPLENCEVSLTYGRVDAFGTWNKLQSHIIINENPEGIV